MKVSRKKPISKPIPKPKKHRVIPVDEEEATPLFVHLQQNMWAILCEPHKYYKVRGIKAILYAGARYLADGVNNSSLIDPNFTILEVLETDENVTDKLVEFISKLQIQRDAISNVIPYLDSVIPLVVEAEQLQMEPTPYPCWPDKITNVINRASKDPSKRKILISGSKNTGKSTLSTYIQTHFITKSKPVCLLDLDIGKGRGLPATINLYRYNGSSTTTSTYWVGEYTPLNFCDLYLQSVMKVMEEYNTLYFNDVLIVNTMGYLTGLGELVMIELNRIIQPSQVLYLTKEEDKQSYTGFRELLTNNNRRLRLLERDHIDFTPIFELVINYYAFGKQNATSKSKSFEQWLNLRSIEDIVLHRLPEVKYEKVLLQTKDGLLLWKPLDPLYTDLQLVIICDVEGKVFRLKGLGFGFGGKVFSEARGEVCLKSEVVQFEKQFYNMTEKQLVSLEETIGATVDFMLPVYKGLGNMGYRNLSSKKVMRG